MPLERTSTMQPHRQKDPQTGKRLPMLLPFLLRQLQLVSTRAIHLLVPEKEEEQKSEEAKEPPEEAERET